MTDDTDLREAMRTVRGTWRVWLLLFATLAIGGWGFAELYKDRESARADLARADTRATEKQAELSVSDQEKTALKDELKKLEEENQALLPLKQKEESSDQAKEEHQKALEAFKTAIADKLKADLGKDVKVTSSADKGIVEVTDKLFFDTPDAPAMSKHGAEAIAILVAAIADVKPAKVRVVAHGEPIPPPGDKTKGAQVAIDAMQHVGQIARALHEKVKGVDVEASWPLAKGERKRVEIQLDLERSK
jgi:hypothetical protein